jgi:type III pantothenate kinase
VLRGAGVLHGWPCMVVDAGTALTFTRGGTDGLLLGGAILPGLGLSLKVRQDSAMLDKMPR